MILPASWCLFSSSVISLNILSLLLKKSFRIFFFSSLCVTLNMIRTICHYLFHSITIIESKAIFIAAINVVCTILCWTQTKGCLSTKCSRWNQSNDLNNGASWKTATTDDGDDDDDDTVVSTKRFMCTALKLCKII